MSPTERVFVIGIKRQGESVMWIKPAYTDLRLGFEITMYVSNR
ncbi:coenzyme PQQ peptide PqqA [Burkholderia cepacia]|nr:coenzyme PQQ peptide PqqA [Burkholderia cepacia]QOH36358.1 coenzyme PQQ peptide PqqA [Burkholderia cepacia]